MGILLKSVQIIAPSTSLPKNKSNVLIVDGFIDRISTSKIKVKKTIDASGLMLSIGWFNMRSHFCDPGYEYKEDLYSGCNAAAAGGFRNRYISG